MFLTTFFSGIVDASDRVELGGYPALLRDPLGVWVEEWMPLADGQTNRLEVVGQPERETRATRWIDLLHPTTARVLAAYRDDFCAGRAAVTRNDHGAGACYYLGTELEPAFLADTLRGVCDEWHIHAPLDTPPGVEASVRRNDVGTECLFLLNHGDQPAPVSTARWQGSVDLLTSETCGEQIEISGRGVVVLRKSNPAT